MSYAPPTITRLDSAGKITHARSFGSVLEPDDGSQRGVRSNTRALLNPSGFSNPEVSPAPAPGRGLGSEILELLNLAWPIALSELARNLHATTDLIILAHRHPGGQGSKQVAAVGAAYMVLGLTDMPLVTSVVTLLTLCGEAYGAQNYTLAGTWTQIMLLVCWVSCVPLLIGRIFTGEILSLLPNLSQYSDMAGFYMHWLMCSVFFDFTYLTLRLYLASQGIVLLASINDGVFVAVNAVLGYVLVFLVFGGEGNDSLEASALATLVARVMLCFSFCFFSFVVMKYHRGTWECKPREVFKISRFCTLLGLAVPAALGTFWEALQYQVVQYMAAYLGPDVMAAQTLMMNSILYNIFTISNGMASAAGIRVAACLGAGDPMGAKRAANIAISVAAGIGMCIGVLLKLFGEQLMPLIVPAGDHTDPGTQYLCKKLCQWMLPLCVAVFITFNTVLSILMKQGRTRLPSLILPVCTWCIGCPLSWYFGIHQSANKTGIDKYETGLLGLWYGLTSGYLVVLICYFVMFFASDWQKYSEESRKRAEVAEITEVSGSTSPASPAAAGDTQLGSQAGQSLQIVVAPPS